jgi:hypothetical protein
MATMLFPLSKLFATAQALLAWLAGAGPAPAAGTPVRAAYPRPPQARTAAPTQVRARPLRVVRVLEPSAPRAVAGRMVISGRLADVCAELDRLAALEGRAS